MDGRQIAVDEAARELGIARGYAYMLRVGSVSPSLKLAFRIAAWAERRGGRVPVASWLDYIK